MKTIELDIEDKRTFVIDQLKKSNWLDRAIRRDEAKVWARLEAPVIPKMEFKKQKWSPVSIYLFAKGLRP